MTRSREKGQAAGRRALAERSAPLYREIARRRSGAEISTKDVAEQLDSLIYEISLHGIDRQAAAGLIIRLAREAVIG